MWPWAGGLASLILRSLSCKPQVVSTPACARLLGVEAGWASGTAGTSPTASGEHGGTGGEGTGWTGPKESRPSSQAPVFGGLEGVSPPRGSRAGSWHYCPQEAPGNCGSRTPARGAGPGEQRVAAEKQDQVGRRAIAALVLAQAATSVLRACRSRIATLLGGDGRPSSEGGLWAEACHVQTRKQLQDSIGQAGCSLENDCGASRP